MINRILPTLSPRPLLLIGMTAGLLVLAACQPVRDPAVVAAERTAVASGAAPAAATSAPATPVPASEVPGIGPAEVTISTDRLRVRALPTEDAEIITRVEEGEVYPVTGISSDGGWLQIETDEGTGWVSAEFVTLAGDITNIPIVEVTDETTGEATAAPTEAATAEPTEAAATETPEATEEAAAVTPEPTEEATVEATEEATEEATPAATEEAAEEATPEATPVPAEEAAAEGTPAPTEEAAAEATPAATEEATEEAAAEATVPETVTIRPDLDLPLRVRSEPNTDTEDNKIGNVRAGETYNVLQVSEDGLWVQIAVPDMGDGTGWVATEFVVFND